MSKFTVISIQDHQVVVDHVYAVSTAIAFLIVAIARCRAELIAALPGHHDGIECAGEGVVDGSQLIENAQDDEAQMAFLRALLAQEGFETLRDDEGHFFWSKCDRSEQGPSCVTEAEAINNCVDMNPGLLPFNEDGTVGTDAVSAA